MDPDKKELKRQYARTSRPMGVFQVRNLANGKIFIDSAVNLNGKINSCRFQLTMGAHMNKALQADFTHSGENNFAIEVVDLLEPKPGAACDYTDDLKMLEEMWIEKLKCFGEKGYNRKPGK